MSLVGTSDDRLPDPAATRTMPGWHRSAPRLFWRLKRPKARVYLRATGKLLSYRVVAAAAAGLAVTLCALIGAIARNMDFPRWSSLIRIRIQAKGASLAAPHAREVLNRWAASIHSQTVTAAIARAAADLARLVPAFMLIGLILVSIPRAHRAIFRLTMLGGVALGYSQRHLPPLPRSAVTEAIITRSASLSTQATRHLSASSSLVTTVLPVVLVTIVAFILYHYAYVLTRRSMGFIPLRPVNHERTTFRAVSLMRRLAAAVITTALFAADLWIVRNIRMSVPGTLNGVFLIKHVHLSVTGWMVIGVVAGLITCMPRPNGTRWLLIAILGTLLIYASMPDVNLIPVPSLLPFPPGSLWVLVLAYLFVTGFGFDLIAGLLDWPG